MDKKLTLVIIGPIENRHADLKRLLAQEGKERGLQVIVLGNDDVLPNLAPEVPKLNDFVRNIYRLNKLISLQTNVFNLHQSDVFQLDKRVRSILKLNRIFVRRSGERFRRRVSFPCCSR